MSTPKSLDPRCVELARAFLSELEGSTDGDRADLAEAIQATAEDFCANLRDELEGPKF